jgi:hypothetical protein
VFSLKYEMNSKMLIKRVLCLKTRWGKKREFNRSSCDVGRDHLPLYACVKSRTDNLVFIEFNII